MGLTLGHCGGPPCKATLSGGLGNLGSIVYNWVNELQASGSHTSDEDATIDLIKFWTFLSVLENVIWTVGTISIASTAYRNDTAHFDIWSIPCLEDLKKLNPSDPQTCHAETLPRKSLRALGLGRR